MAILYTSLWRNWLDFYLLPHSLIVTVMNIYLKNHHLLLVLSLVLWKPNSVRMRFTDKEVIRSVAKL